MSETSVNQDRATPAARTDPSSATVPPDAVSPNSDTPFIEFEDVSIAFGSRRVLDHVSYSIPRGQTLCILGRSGVGKSVSLRILLGFLKPDSGSVRVEGREVTTLDESALQQIRRHVTMVFQNGALFDSLTVGENVAFPLREAGHLEEDQVQQLTDRMLDLVESRDLRDVFPSSLSTGQKRQIAIARALAAQPRAILYDEPTTMVDPLAARHVGDLIQRLKRQLGLTSIVVTHDMRFASRLADLVLFLESGKVRFFGPIADFHRCQDREVEEFLHLDAYELPQIHPAR